MLSNHRAFIVPVLFVLLATLACGLGPVATPTPAPVATQPPQAPAVPTDTPLPPTETPIPPTPTVAAIPATNQPIDIGAFNLTITEVVLNEKGYNGLAPYPMTADQTVLTVVITLNSGDLAALSQLEAFVTDEGSNQTKIGAGMSVDSKNQIIWMFPVLKTARTFILHFPSGEALDLSPLLPK